jgi:hypothetical protein
MFQKLKPLWPPSATLSFEVRYSKGRKPFDNLPDAQSFAATERANGGWAEIAQLGRVVVEKRQ